MSLSRRGFGRVMVGPLMSTIVGCRRRSGSRAATPPGSDATPALGVSVEVDAGASVGAFDRLSGVQGSPGPILEGEPDLSAGFRALGLEHARFPQDCLPNTLTLGGIFQNANADPDAIASYSFEGIDRHVSAARAVGAEVLWQASYDVGRSDRWVGLNLGGQPPDDLTRWARVVSRCLEHFNNGWANGFEHSVRNAEFLNEPDGLGGFSGAHATRLFPAFAEFLGLVARYNATHPNTPVRAVGPGIPLSLAEWKRWEPRFAAGLDRLLAAKLDLPVFSFHTYGSDVSPAANGRLARAIRGLLDRKGMQRTALWNTEWQAGDFAKQLLDVGPARAATASEADQKMFASALAAYAVACKLRWQGVVTGSYYYRANRRAFPEGRQPEQDRSAIAGFFSKHARPLRLGLHEELMRLSRASTPERCATGYEDDGVLTLQGLRAADGNTLGLVVSSLHLVPRTISLRFVGTRAALRWRARVHAINGRQEGIAVAALGVPTTTARGLEIATVIAPLSSALLVLEAIG